MPLTFFSSIHPSHPFTSPLVSPDMVYSPETSLSQFSDLIFQRAIKPRWFTLQCATRSTADLLTSFSKRREKLSSENYTRFNITPEIEKDVASQRVDQSGKYMVINTDIQSPSDGTHCQPPFMNHHQNDKPFSVFLLIFCSYSRARHLRRPLGIMTMLATCVNPAIGSGSMLPSIARLYVWADGWSVMPNLLDSSLKGSFPQARRLRLAIMPLLFIAFLLEWHIFNHYDQSAGAQV